MSDYTLNILKMKSKKYEDYVNCINPDYNRDEEVANEVITRFNEYEKENQELNKQIETLEKANKQLIYKLDRYDAIVDERDELNKQLKAELQEANDNIIWWSNRFKAVQRDYENLKEKIDKAIELTKNLLKTEDRGYYQIIFKEILKSLGDKE